MRKRPGGLSAFEAAVAVGVALLVGVLGSLALRPAARPMAAGEGGARLAPLRWRLPISIGTNLPGLGDNALYLAERVAATSGGRVRLEVFEPGELVPAFSVIEAVSQGKVDVGLTWLGYDHGRVPASVLLGAVPFGMEPAEYLAWWHYAGGRELGEALYRRDSVHPILCGLIGPESAGWFRDEIRSLDDLRGLKIRFAGIGGQVLQRLGASVTMLPGGEIFQALEKGAIDATEFSMPAIDERLGFERVVAHNYFPGWHQPSSSFHLLVYRPTWEAIPEADRALLETACAATVANGLAKSESLQGRALRGFEERGVAIRRLPEPVLRELERITRTIEDEEAAADADFAEILASQRAFRADYRSWKTLGFLPRDF